MLGSLILYLKGMRILMFQLSGFYCSIVQYLVGSTTVPRLAPDAPSSRRPFRRREPKYPLIKNIP